MQVVQRVIALGRSARNDSKLKVRQPLARLLVRAPDEAAAAAVTKHAELIKEELNVKAIELIPRDAQLVTGPHGGLAAGIVRRLPAPRRARDPSS